MASMDGGIAIFPGAPETIRSGDVHHRYRQDSDFLYLTGFTEPGAVLVLDPEHPKHRFRLYVQPRDPDKERWTGRRVGVAGARSRFGADAAFEAHTFRTDLPDLLAGRGKVFLRVGSDPHLDQDVLGHIATLRTRTRAGQRGPLEVVDPAPTLAEFRLLKSEDEIEALQRAAEVTADGHLAAMCVTRPGVWEYEVEAAIEYAFRKAGATGPAYPTICGAGENATILHYIDNDHKMKRGQLLLIDAGAEVNGYAGDVTRTLPVSGRFTDAQRALYTLVLDAQKAAIRKVKPGVTFDAVHQVAVKKLAEGLVALGLLEGPPARVVRSGDFRRFYMHRTSHWLGLDVHDVGSYVSPQGNSRPLEPGMVLTVEPGLYIGAEAGIPKDMHHTGIRIEDDVLVTERGCRVLTESIPKEVDDIERIMADG